MFVGSCRGDICGSTKGPLRHKESWWWDDECSKAVDEKRRLYGIWQESKNGNDEEKARKTNRLIRKQRRMLGEL